MVPMPVYCSTFRCLCLNYRALMGWGAFSSCTSMHTGNSHTFQHRHNDDANNASANMHQLATSTHQCYKRSRAAQPAQWLVSPHHLTTHTEYAMHCARYTQILAVSQPVSAQRMQLMTMAAFVCWAWSLHASSICLLLVCPCAATSPPGTLLKLAKVQTHACR